MAAWPMNARRQAIIASAVVAAASAAGIVTIGAASIRAESTALAPAPTTSTSTSTSTTTSTPVARAEDDPGWDCHRQGNGVCGPVTIDTAHRVVIAANGRFGYTAVVHRDGPMICVEGPRPIGVHDVTALACGEVTR